MYLKRRARSWRENTRGTSRGATWAQRWVNTKTWVSQIDVVKWRIKIIYSSKDSSPLVKTLTTRRHRLSSARALISTSRLHYQRPLKIVWYEHDTLLSSILGQPLILLSPLRMMLESKLSVGFFKTPELNVSFSIILSLTRSVHQSTILSTSSIKINVNLILELLKPCLKNVARRDWDLIFFFLPTIQNREFNISKSKHRPIFHRYLKWSKIRGLSKNWRSRGTHFSHL
jgi:hypothetical protein